MMKRVPGHIRGKLQTAVRQQRRATLYASLLKRNYGKVPCFVCKEHVPQDQATLEHIVPRSLGGTDDMQNLSISHAKCNRERGNQK